ncbi:hypothetical protein GIB67_000276 [Kingdonia uniflora]|uniref:Uncharacterized protein n=1 Tax=Kingdonia uniflora TaxID=39325 RepID=A0A7J7LCB8_9MAGN|nr:hypothetical protein GIB67_000276 [Kingdonia uniflora]
METRLHSNKLSMSHPGPPTPEKYERTRRSKSSSHNQFSNLNRSVMKQNSCDNFDFGKAHLGHKGLYSSYNALSLDQNSQSLTTIDSPSRDSILAQRSTSSVSSGEVQSAGRRCSPPPSESLNDNSGILKDMFGTNVAYGTVQFNTTAPEGFYSVIIDEVIYEEACLYVESRTLGDVSAGEAVAWLKIFYHYPVKRFLYFFLEFKANPGKLFNISIFILDIGKLFDMIF